MKLTPVQIEPEDVGRFSIDEMNNLYWDGQLIHTEAVIKLTAPQNRLAKVVGIAAIVGSLATAANATASWLTYFSRIHSAVADQAPKPSPTATQSKLKPTPEGSSEAR